MSTCKTITLENACWISPGGKCSTPMIRGIFSLPKNTKASMVIAGLGTYECHINGKRVSEDLFLPLSTDFNARPDMLYMEHPFEEEMGHRLYCPEYDITSYLKEGENAVCFLMGPGWYELNEWDCGYGKIKLAFEIRITGENGEVICYGSNPEMEWKESFVKEAFLTTGECQDYRGYCDDWMKLDEQGQWLEGNNGWNKVTPEAAPETALFLQECPADRVIRHITPVLLEEKNGVRLYDLGEMITGYPVFSTKAPVGSVIKVRYSESLHENGGLDEEKIFNQHTDFITDGKERRLHCRFTWLCFRYFEVTGDAQVEDCLVIHSNVAVDSSFTCSSPVLNWLRDAYIRTQLNNMHCGIPSDCPHIERRGYTGDGQLTCHTAMLQLDAKAFYKKWIYDIADCQDKKSGHVQYTAPFMPSGGGPGGWGCAIVVVPYMYYKHYGDKEILRELYPQMLFWFESLEDHSEKELVTTDFPDAWCLGDWCALAMGFNVLRAMVLPEPLVNTYFYIKSMEMVLEIGEILGNHEQDELLKQRIARKKQALVDAYFDPATGDFAKGEQGANVFALDLGLGDARTLENTLAFYREFGQYDTGIFATDILTRYLFEHGQAKLAIQLLTSEKKYTFYERMKMGATTIPEYWTGHRSQCHPMFGAVCRCLFEYVLGIRQTGDSVCFEKIVIEPLCMELIPKAQGHITTALGQIWVSYDAEKICVTVPAGVSALLRMDGKEWQLESGVENIRRR